MYRGQAEGEAHRTRRDGGGSWKDHVRDEETKGSGEALHDRKAGDRDGERESKNSSALR